MNSRVITKNIEVDGRKFVVKKYTAMDGLKIAKLVMAKILPVFQDFIPLVKKIQEENTKPSLEKGKPEAETDENDDTEANENNDTEANLKMFSDVVDNISLDTIATALEKVSDRDFDYIMKKSLQSITEVLPAGESPVMYSSGSYGVEGIEYDPIIVLRLTCEAVMWGCGDFFDGNRWNSVMKPMFGG